MAASSTWPRPTTLGQCASCSGGQLCLWRSTNGLRKFRFARRVYTSRAWCAIRCSIAGSMMTTASGAPKWARAQFTRRRTLPPNPPIQRFGSAAPSEKKKSEPVPSKRVNQSRDMRVHTTQSESAMARAVRRYRQLRKRNYIEDLALHSDAGLDALSQRRRWLIPIFVCGLIATALVWILALRFPGVASSMLSNGVSLDSKLLMILVLSIPFTPPFISLFALGNLLFPSGPAPEVAVGIMSSFEYRQKAGKQYMIVIASAMLGGLNCLLIMWALAEATGN